MKQYEEPNMKIEVVEGYVVVELSSEYIGGGDGELDPWG